VIDERWELQLGEERPVKLPVFAPPAEWRAEVSGMQSAVRVQRMWASDPYRDIDEEDEGSAADRREAPAMVFMVRGVAPGEATVRFELSAASPDATPRVIQVSVRR
jgi:hypothetical protein